MMMFDLIHRRAVLDPHRLALQDLHDGTRYSYQELNHRAAQFACAARNCWHLGEGDRIAYLGHSRAEFFACWFGCAKAGLILVPLNWRLSTSELLAVLTDSTPRALIYGAEFAQTAQTLHARMPGLVLIALEHDVQTTPSNHRSYAEDLEAHPPDLAEHPLRPGNTPWYLLYTSGTTGKPKGVIQTFEMMHANYCNIGLATELGRRDTLLNILPLFHTAGINLYSSCLFWVGGSVRVQRQFDPALTLQHLSDATTVFFAVPTIYQALIDHPDFNAAALASVRSWGCGGAARPKEIARRYADHGILIRCGMGMTETGPTIFLMDQERALHKPGSVGRPQLTTQVRVVGRNGRDVGPGQAAELWVRGPGITPGYWCMPEATEAAFAPGGWFRTGDVVRCDEEGDFTIVDRWKDMIISGGENIYPAEVENVLLQHPAIKEAAVVGVPDEKWGEVGHAFLVANNQCPPDDTAIRNWCRQSLAGYKIPRYVSWLTALPRNALGKVTKQELRDARPTS